MTNEEIVKLLRGMAMDVFRTCEGCDLEENCSVRGCAILMAAADAMENLQAENAALRRTIDNLTSAQAVVLKEFEAKLEELAEVKAGMRWISVKDRLPDRTIPPRDVLVYHDLNCGMFIDRVWYKLMRYEDTGMAPEEIADFMKRWERTVEIAGLCKKGGIDHLLELKKAENEGKLIVLPWKVGDVIYKADPAHGVVKHTFAGEPAWMMHSYAVDDAGNEWYDGWGSSDETPFYKTREEAEAAMAQKGGEG